MMGSFVTSMEGRPEAPRISVVIPLYNKRDTICRAVESVYRQTVKPCDIIVVDDGSTDGGAEMLPHMTDESFRIIRQQNGGVSCARNAGIQAASGSHVAFLDGDDEWDPDHLHMLADLAIRFPAAGFFATGFRIRLAASRSAYSSNRGSITSPGILSGEAFYGKISGLSLPFVTSSSMCERKLLGEIGFFTLGQKRTEDMDLFFRALALRPVAFQPGCSVSFHGDASFRVTRQKQYRCDPFAEYGLHALAQRAAEGGAEGLGPNQRRYLGLVAMNSARFFLAERQADSAGKMLKIACVLGPSGLQRVTLIILMAGPGWLSCPLAIMWVLGQRAWGRVRGCFTRGER